MRIFTSLSTFPFRILLTSTHFAKLWSSLSTKCLVSRIFFLQHILWEYFLAKIFYYPQCILLYNIISPPVSFFYNDSSTLQQIFPLLSLILRVTYYSFCDGSAVFCCYSSESVFENILRWLSVIYQFYISKFPLQSSFAYSSL